MTEQIPEGAKQHPEHKHLYATEDGKIWSTKSNRFVGGITKDRNTIDIYIQNSSIKRSRLIYECFNNLILTNNYIIKHKDQNNSNDSIENLELQQLFRHNQFEKDERGNLINPNTNQTFQNGDIISGKQFYKNPNGEISFYDSQKARDNKRKYYRENREDYVGKKRKVDFVVKTLHQAAKQRCKEKNGKITISKKWVKDRINTCAYTGIPTEIGTNGDGTREPFAPSLDRIDNEKPNYTPGNTHVVLSAVNSAKSDLNITNFNFIIQRLAHVLKNPHLQGNEPQQKKPRRNSF